MGSLLAIKSGTTSVQGATVKGDFRYFSASTLDLGPTSITGLYSGIDAPNDGYTVYQIGGPNGLNARVATNTTELNTILITAGATGSTLNDRIIWATNTNTIFINSGTTSPFYFFGGEFTATSVLVTPYFTSLNSDGTQNTSLNIGTGFGNFVESIEVQTDGKILAGGRFSTFTGTTQNYLIRLNSDGSKDTSFNIGTGFDFDVYSISVQSDGKILAGGNFTTFTGTTQNRLIRLNSNGSKDTSFNIGTGFNSLVYSTEIQSDGKILVGGAFTTFTGATQNRLIRLNSDGSNDTSFNIGTGFDNNVTSIAIQSDGKILVGGDFTTFTGTTQNRLVRLNSDGSRDTSFNIGTGFNFIVESCKVQSDGKILVGGAFTTFSGASQSRLIRLNSDGSRDTSFNIGSGFGGRTYSIAIQSDGKILVGGAFSTFTGSSQNGLVRLNSNGSRDTSFNIGIGFNSDILSVKVQSDGKIFTGGAFTSFSGVTQNRFTKYKSSDYTLDTSFNIGTGPNGFIYSTKIQSDKKILVGGQFSTFSGATQNRLIRLNSNGSRDTSFNIGSGFNSSVRSIAIQSDGKILVGGDFLTFTGSSQNKLIRLNSDGSKDTSFNIGTGFDFDVYSISVQSDGKILAGGNFTTFTGTTQNRLIRLNSNGSKDTSFNIGTGFNSLVYSTEIQSDGKILVGGGFSTFSGSSQNGLVRLNSDGSRDTSFNIGTGFGGGIVNSVVIGSDGKILVGGGFTTFRGSSQSGLARLNSDGSIDTSLVVGTGFAGAVISIAIQSDGKILIGGGFIRYNGVNSYNAILLNSGGDIINNTFLFNRLNALTVVID